MRFIYIRTAKLFRKGIGKTSNGAVCCTTNQISDLDAATDIWPANKGLQTLNDQNVNLQCEEHLEKQ